ncbi:MAG: AraC family transcriptional regulator [Flavobacterium sp.]|nr:AraC family transcriptional regulator [Flavobacterium sp.]
MRLFIKNMVSLRCKMMVKQELEKLGIEYTIVELGEITIVGVLSKDKTSQLEVALNEIGLEILDNKKTQLVEKIKNIVIEMIHYAEELPRTNFSDYLSEKLNMDYTNMSNVFSRTKGITIEHFIVLHKIERVKELLIYDELSIKEIAFKMNYSGSSHLSNQFKKVTGLTPTFFKTMKTFRRNGLEDL